MSVTWRALLLLSALLLGQTSGSGRPEQPASLISSAHRRRSLSAFELPFPLPGQSAEAAGRSLAFDVDVTDALVGLLLLNPGATASALQASLAASLAAQLDGVAASLTLQLHSAVLFSGEDATAAVEPLPPALLQGLVRGALGALEPELGAGGAAQLAVDGAEVLSRDLARAALEGEGFAALLSAEDPGAPGAARALRAALATLTDPAVGAVLAATLWPQLCERADVCGVEGSVSVEEPTVRAVGQLRAPQLNGSAPLNGTNATNCTLLSACHGCVGGNCSNCLRAPTPCGSACDACTDCARCPLCPHCNCNMVASCTGGAGNGTCTYAPSCSNNCTSSCVTRLVCGANSTLGGNGTLGGGNWTLAGGNWTAGNWSGCVNVTTCSESCDNASACGACTDCAHCPFCPGCANATSCASGNATRVAAAVALPYANAPAVLGPAGVLANLSAAAQRAAAWPPGLARLHASGCLAPVSIFVCDAVLRANLSALPPGVDVEATLLAALARAHASPRLRVRVSEANGSAVSVVVSGLGADAGAAASAVALLSPGSPSATITALAPPQLAAVLCGSCGACVDGGMFGPNGLYINGSYINGSLRLPRRRPLQVGQPGIDHEAHRVAGLFNGSYWTGSYMNGSHFNWSYMNGSHMNGSYMNGSYMNGNHNGYANGSYVNGTGSSGNASSVAAARLALEEYLWLVVAGNGTNSSLGAWLNETAYALPMPETVHAHSHAHDGRRGAAPTRRAAIETAAWGEEAGLGSVRRRALDPLPGATLPLSAATAPGHAFPQLSLWGNVSGALTVTVTGTYSDDTPAWRTLFNLGGLVASIHPGAANISYAARSVYVPDFISFSNNASGNVNCAHGAYLTAASGSGYAGWPANTTATLTFSVAADGTLAAPTLGGAALQPVLWPDHLVLGSGASGADAAALYAAQQPQVCLPLAWTPASGLYVGAFDGSGDNFPGTLTAFDLSLLPPLSSTAYTYSLVSPPAFSPPPAAPTATATVGISLAVTGLVGLSPADAEAAITAFVTAAARSSGVSVVLTGFTISSSMALAGVSAAVWAATPGAEAAFVAGLAGDLGVPASAVTLLNVSTAVRRSLLDGVLIVPFSVASPSPSTALALALSAAISATASANKSSLLTALQLTGLPVALLAASKPLLAAQLSVTASPAAAAALRSTLDAAPPLDVTAAAHGMSSTTSDAAPPPPQGRAEAGGRAPNAVATESPARDLLLYSCATAAALLMAGALVNRARAAAAAAESSKASYFQAPAAFEEERLLRAPRTPITPWVQGPNYG